MNRQPSQFDVLGTDVPVAVPVRIADLHIALPFIDALKSASLDDENLDAEVLE
jgi:hypothetical protein